MTSRGPDVHLSRVLRTIFTVFFVHVAFGSEALRKCPRVTSRCIFKHILEYKGPNVFFLIA